MNEIESKLSARYWRFCCEEADKIASYANDAEWLDAARTMQMGDEI